MRNLAKIIVIGIDSGCWEYLNPLLEESRLPNIKQLIENGTRGILKSTIPPLSPVAWSSFITGKRPENHGIFDFWHIQANPGEKGLGRYFRPVSPQDRKNRPFWKYLNQKGLRVGIMNIPTTYPPDKVNGFFISGYDSPEKSEDMVYPKYLYKELLQKYGEGIFNLPTFDFLSIGETEKFINLYAQHDEKQTLAAIELAKKYDVSNLIINYMMNDHFNHRMKNYTDVEKGLEIIDKNIGLFIEEFPSASFILLSDHGSMRTRGAFLITEWLIKKRLLQFKYRSHKVRRLKVAFNHFLTRLNLQGKSKKYIKNAIVMPLQFFPKCICNKLINSITNEKSVLYWPWDDIDFSKSLVALCSPAIGGFYLSSSKNGLPGLLNSQEYHNVRETLKTNLNQIINQDMGLPLAIRIYNREEVYGHSIRQAPDFTFYSLFSINTRARLKCDDENGYFVKNDQVNYYGNHTEEGIYIFSGSSFSNKFNSTLCIWDIPAIILHLNSIPIPTDLDGEISEQIFSEKYIKEKPISYQKVLDELPQETSLLSDDETEAVKSHLKDLGYM